MALPLKKETTKAPSLKDVISIIPAKCYENPAWKAFVYILGDSILYCLAMYALAITDNPLLLVPLWALAGLSVSALFILGHDASHGALFKSKGLRDYLGRLLMLPTFHAYSAWGLGHNRVHHSFTIKHEKDFVWHPLTVDEYRGLSWFGKLKHRLEWSAFGPGIYYLFEIWWKKMIYYRPPTKMLKSINEDRRAVLYFALFTIFLALVIGKAMDVSVIYSVWVWVKMLIIPWMVFNYIIGATVHIHHIQPDIPWHSHDRWNKFKGQVQGTTNFRVPLFLNIFFHNIFIHIPHHVDPRIPFYNLPLAAEAIKEHFKLSVRDNPMRLSTYWQATRLCKLYDFEREIWLNYRGEPSLPEALAA